MFWQPSERVTYDRNYQFKSMTEVQVRRNGNTIDSIIYPHLTQRLR